MTNLHEQLAGWSVWLWPQAANHLWQATLVAGLAALAVLLLRRSPARARYAVWLLAAAKFALPSAALAGLLRQAGVDAARLLPAPAGDGGGSVVAVAQLFEPVTEAAPTAGAGGGHNELFCALTLVWLTGFLFLLGAWAWRRLRFVLAMREGRFLKAGREADALDRVRRRLGVRRPMRLLLMPRVIEPGVWGVFRPVMVLPETLAEGLSDDELESVLSHEAVHVARWDNLIANAHLLVCCLFWFHPLVWLIDRRLLNERERVCDEAVVRAGGAPQVYAASLVKVLRFCLDWKMAGVSYATGANLRRRVEDIMAKTFEERPTPARRLLVGAALALVAVAAVATGLFNRGYAAGDRLVNNFTESAAAAGGQKDAKDQLERALKEAQDRIENAPAVAVNYENAEGAPLTISDARFKVLVMKGEPARDKAVATVDEDRYIFRPVIQLTNTTNRRITGIKYEFGGPKFAAVRYELARPPIEPYGAYTSDKATWFITRSRGENYADGKFKVIGVVFEGGETWGDMTPPPALTTAVPPAGPGPAGTPPSGAGPAGTPPDVPGPNKVIRQSGGVLQGAAMKRVQPRYPTAAKEAGVSGAVTVEVLVDEEGNVISAQATAGPPLLQAAAVEAARHWQFQPTMLDGQPVKVTGSITFNFTL